MDDLLLDEYLDYLQEALSPGTFFVGIGLIYSIFKQWQKRKEIENRHCKEFKGDPLKLDLCVYEKQMKNCQEIMSKLKTNAHTCARTRRPNRCREKVRYFIRKYEKRAIDLEKKIQKTKFKIAKKEYKAKIRKIKKQQLIRSLGD